MTRQDWPTVLVAGAILGLYLIAFWHGPSHWAAPPIHWPFR